MSNSKISLKIGTIVKHFQSPTGFAKLVKVTDKNTYFEIFTPEGQKRHPKTGLLFKVFTYNAEKMFA